jgi:hypothetical protein
MRSRPRKQRSRWRGSGSTISACWSATAPFRASCRRRGPGPSSPPPAKRVALSLSAKFVEVVAVARETRPDIIQVQATAADFPLAMLRLEALLPEIAILRAVAMTDETAIEIARSYRGVADFLLLDNPRNARPASGRPGPAHRRGDRHPRPSRRWARPRQRRRGDCRGAAGRCRFEDPDRPRRRNRQGSRQGPAICRRPQSDFSSVSALDTAYWPGASTLSTLTTPSSISIE